MDSANKPLFNNLNGPPIKGTIPIIHNGTPTTRAAFTVAPNAFTIVPHNPSLAKSIFASVKTETILFPIILSKGHIKSCITLAPIFHAVSSIACPFLSRKLDIPLNNHKENCFIARETVLNISVIFPLLNCSPNQSLIFLAVFFILSLIFIPMVV